MGGLNVGWRSKFPRLSMNRNEVLVDQQIVFSNILIYEARFVYWWDNNSLQSD